MPKATSIKRKKQETPWEFPHNIDLTKYFGFVYLIENVITGKKYIGRKYLWRTVKKAVPTKKRRIKVTEESDWRYYKSSCIDLKEEITKLGIDKFTFKVLSFYETRAQVNYHEVREQFTRDVLNTKNTDGEYEYYNTNILSRYFRGRV